MTEQSVKFLSLSDLMSAVGSFLFRWSLMAQGLTDATTDGRERLNKAPVKTRGPFAERLDIWAELTKALPENEAIHHLVEDVHSQAISL